MREITAKAIKLYYEYLISEEKAVATVNKYLHDIEKFKSLLGKRELCKTTLLYYKSERLRICSSIKCI